TFATLDATRWRRRGLLGWLANLGKSQTNANGLSCWGLTQRRHITGFCATVRRHSCSSDQEEGTGIRNGRVHDIARTDLLRDVFAVSDRCKVHQTAITGTTTKAVLFIIFAAFSLHQKLHVRADQLGIFFRRNLILQLNPPLETLLHDVLWHLLVHGGSGSARPWGVLEGVCGAKTCTPHDIHGALEIFLGRSWETDDDIRGDSSMRHLLTYFIHNAHELLRAVRPAHILEYFVGSRLQRHVQLWADRGSLSHRVNDIRGKFRRVRGSKPQTL